MSKRGQGQALAEFAEHLAETGNVRDAARAMKTTVLTGKSYLKRIKAALGWQAR